MSAFERFAIEHPRARRWLLAAAVAGLVAYAVWASRGDGRLAAMCVAAAIAGAGTLALAARADRALYAASPAGAMRWARRAATAGAVLGAVGAVVLAPRTGAALAAGLSAFLAGALAVATFLYPLPAVRLPDDRRAD